MPAFLHPFGMVAALALPPLGAATLTITPGPAGTTPDRIGYNLAHFMPGSNAADWWRYSGVKAARVFLTPTAIEANDDLAPHGDGVDSQVKFLGRRAALRLNPLAVQPSGAEVPLHLRAPFIGWPYLEDRYENSTLPGNNRFRVNHAFGELRSQGVDILVQITGSTSAFPITDGNDWAGLWELWQHYYFQTYYLGRTFGVERHSMFNEPNHPAAGGITTEDWLRRLRFASDAIQAAITDVNRDHGTALVARVHAPTTSGTIGAAYDDWGRPAVEGRRLRFDGISDPAWSNFQTYSYQYYGITPATLFSQASTLRANLTGLMPGEPELPLAITEFNVRTGSSFDAVTATLDRPDHYSALGADAIALSNAGLRSIYLFKFGQTAAQSTDSDYPVQKNGIHHVDNRTGTSANPYGGITRAGEVWRLFNRMATGGRQRHMVARSAGLDSLDVMASFDAVNQIHHLFTVNRSDQNLTFDIDVRGLGIPHDNRVTVSEVSTRCHGGVKHFTRVNDGRIAPPGATQPARSVWLVSIPVRPQAIQGDGTPTLLVNAAGDANLRDGSFRETADGTGDTLQVRNGTISADDRRAALIRFDLSALDLSDLETVVLTLDASSTLNGTAAQAHVYGLAQDTWGEGTMTWAQKTQLKQHLPAGPRIEHNVVSGDAATVLLQGQIVADSTAPAETHLDVTQFVKSQAAGSFSFLIVQESRWDTDLADKEPEEVVTGSGDVQPAGLQIRSRESGSAPRLRIIRRVPSTGAARPIENWRIEHFGSASGSGDAADNHDADQDGAVNLLEYALGGDPGLPDAADFLPRLTVTESHSELAFHRMPERSDLRITIQVSDTLEESWTDAAVSDAGGAFVSLLDGFTVHELPNADWTDVTVREGLRRCRFLRVKAEIIAI